MRFLFFQGFTLWKFNSYGTSPCFFQVNHDRSSINGPFSISISNYWRARTHNIYIYIYIYVYIYVCMYIFVQ